VSVDPLQGERNWLSPFNYCQNNPVNKVDPTGALDEDPPSSNVSTEEIPVLQKKEGDSKLGVGVCEIKGISGLDLGTINFDFTATSKSGNYTINPIISGANSGSWLVRQQFGNGNYKNVLIGGKNTFAELCNENFIISDLSTVETNSSSIKPREALEYYKDITNEDEEFAEYFRNPSWEAYGIVLAKRFLNQFTNPFNYTPGPKLFKAVKIKVSPIRFKNSIKTIKLPKNIKKRGRNAKMRYYVKKHNAKVNQHVTKITNQNEKLSNITGNTNSATVSVLYTVSKANYKKYLKD